MPLIVKDRVRETSTTAGTGTFSLAGAVTGFQSFSVIGNGNTTYYTIALQGGAEWEVGIGTYTSSGTTLSRDVVLESSNSGSLVNFSAGTKDVFVTYPAEKAIYADENDDTIILGEPLYTVTNSITAAGTTQGAATALTAAINNVTTVATSADGVRLMTAKAGMRVLIRNSDSADTLKVYPATGAQINSLAANAAYEVNAGIVVEFFAVSTTQWYSFTAAGWGGF